MATEPIDDTLMADPEDEDQETIEKAKLINEEYKIWKKHAVYLYDLMLRYVCSMTIPA